MIEQPENVITSAMKNLAPPISIFQYYKAFKPLILKVNDLPDIRPRNNISKKQFKAIWNKANPTARDLLIFMWVLKDLITPKGTIEITTADPCLTMQPGSASELSLISTNITTNSTPTLRTGTLSLRFEPYDAETTKELQQMVTQYFPEFLTAMDTLAQRGHNTIP